VNILKLIGQMFIQLVKDACLIPQMISQAFTQRKHRKIVNEFEAERLDRIRNPSKYRGK